MNPERSVLTQDQVARAENRIGITHPVIDILEVHASRIAQINEGLRQFENNQDQQRYISEQMGFFADAVENGRSFSLEPLDLVAVWSKAMEVFDNRYGRYALARIVILSYATQSLANPVWRGLPRHYLKTGELSEEAVKDGDGLLYVKSRLDDISRSDNELDFYASGTRESAMKLAFKLAGLAQNGNTEAAQQLEQLKAYHNEHVTPVLREIKENFGNSLPLIYMQIDAALG